MYSGTCPPTLEPKFYIYTNTIFCFHMASAFVRLLLYDCSTKFPVWVLSLGLWKAFDRVHWGALWLDFFPFAPFWPLRISLLRLLAMMIAAPSSQAVRGCGWPVRCIRTGSVNSRGMDSSETIVWSPCTEHWTKTEPLYLSNQRGRATRMRA